MVNTDGTYTYTPDPDFSGSDTFTFTANDGSVTSNTATITLTVNPVNDAPVAQNGSASGSEDTPITGTVVATDVDSVTLTYALAAQALHGTVVVNSDGTYTYTPTLNFNGTDSFTFTANDGSVTSNTATVTLAVAAVNDAPVNTVPGAQTAQEDTPLLIAGLSVADVDSPTLTVTLSALNGSVAIVPGLALVVGNLSDTVDDHRHAGRGEPGADQCVLPRRSEFQRFRHPDGHDFGQRADRQRYRRDYGRRRRRRTGARPRRQQFERRAGIRLSNHVHRERPSSRAHRRRPPAHR